MKKKILKILLCNLLYVVLTTIFSLPFVLSWAWNACHSGSTVAYCTPHYTEHIVHAEH